MAKHVVTGAMVQVKASTVDGKPALVYVYRGGVVDLDAKQAEHLVSVGLVEKVADVDNDPVANPPAGPTPPPVQLVPDKGDDKSVWEAHAVRNGLSEADAQVASKDDLIAIFADGGLEPPKAEPVKAAPAKSTPAKAPAAKATPPAKS